MYVENYNRKRIKQYEIKKEILDYIKHKELCTTTDIINEFRIIPTWVTLTILDELLEESKVE